jgi:hypothetical protein
MLASREQIKRIFEFQKKKSQELKRQVTHSEALALWLTQRLVGERTRKRMKETSPELFIY